LAKRYKCSTYFLASNIVVGKYVFSKFIWDSRCQYPTLKWLPIKIPKMFVFRNKNSVSPYVFLVQNSTKVYFNICKVNYEYLFIIAAA
jgi:hypothetical protein